MSWDNTDKNTFIQALNINSGQINLDSDVGKLIYNIASDTNFKAYLEIGTWNGLGSTRCFVEGLKKRSNTSPFVFYSLECNKDKANFASNLYKNISNIHILNESLVNQEDIKDAKSVFPDIIDKWHVVDVENIKNCNQFLERKDIPQLFDVILLDGGEYTTYFEFLKIKDKCRVLMMDDVNTDKCKKIVEILNNDNTWRLVYFDHQRNGFAVFERI
jgi:predicted O-methyltransferase YrrM